MPAGFCESTLDELVRILLFACSLEVTIGDDFIKGGVLGVPVCIVEVPAGGLPYGEICFDLDFYVQRKVALPRLEPFLVFTADTRRGDIKVRFVEYLKVYELNHNTFISFQEIGYCSSTLV